MREALLKKHHHQNERRRNNLIPIVRSFAEVGKKQSDLHSMDKDGQTVSPQSAPTTSLEVKNGVNCEHSPVDLSKVDLHFMKKSPLEQRPPMSWLERWTLWTVPSSPL